jgi:hypothetical protein
MPRNGNARGAGADDAKIRVYDRCGRTVLVIDDHFAP